MATSMRSKQKAGTAGGQAATPDGPPGPLLEQKDESQDATSANENEAIRAVRILLYIARVRIANDNEQWLPPDATPAMHAATALVAASFFGVNNVEPIPVEVSVNLEQKKKSWPSTRNAWLKTLEDLEKRGIATQNLSDERMEEGFRLAKRLLARVPQWKKRPPLPRPDPTINTPAAEESETPPAELQTQAVGESTAPAPAAGASVVAANTSAVTPSEVAPPVVSDPHPATTTPDPEAVDDLPAQTTGSDQETSALDLPDERPASTVRSEPPQTPRQKGHESRASTSAVSTGSSDRRRFAGNVGDGSLIGAFPQSPIRSTSDPPRPPRETDPRPQKLADFKLPQLSRFPVKPQPTSSKHHATLDPFSESPARLTDPYLPGNFPQTQDEATKRTATSTGHNEPETNKEARDKKKNSEQEGNKGKCDAQDDVRQKGKQKAHTQTQDEATERTATSSKHNTRDKKKTDEQKNEEGKCNDNNDDRQKGKQKAHAQKNTSSAWHGPLPLPRAPAQAATAQTSEGESSRKAGKRKSDEELRNELLQEQALKRRGRDWEAISGRLFKRS